ncbi:MAG: peptidoglycan DD-metalloendopeptidase family protein, partial [Eubacteriales bacterium]|nr:peptidoglycan DD-metalloendopeptidase family protein [Eubacteriales bacterium]
MFENARPSTLSVLLSSSNIKGFFQGMELAGAVADRDLAVIQELSNAKSLAEILKSNAEITGAKAENFITQISEEIDKLEEGIRLEEETLQSLELQVAQRNQGINELQYKGAVVDANIQRARDEIAYQDTLKKLEQEQPSQIVDQNMPLVPTETQIQAPKPSETPSATKKPRPSEVVTEPEYIEGPEAPKPSSPSNPTTPVTQAPPVESEPPAPSNPPAPAGVSLFFPNGFSQSITSPFGYRGSPINGAGEFHTGTDFQGSFGAPIFAAMGGTVIAANTPVGQGAQYGGWGYGNYIDIQHPNGWVTRYGHLMNVNVSVGQQVSAGEMIGGCGSTGASTGPHLHFEIIIDGRQVDPVPYLFG